MRYPLTLPVSGPRLPLDLMTLRELVHPVPRDRFWMATA